MHGATATAYVSYGFMVGHCYMVRVAAGVALRAPEAGQAASHKTRAGNFQSLPLYCMRTLRPSLASGRASSSSNIAPAPQTACRATGR